MSTKHKLAQALGVSPEVLKCVDGIWARLDCEPSESTSWTRAEVRRLIGEERQFEVWVQDNLWRGRVLRFKSLRKNGTEGKTYGLDLTHPDAVFAAIQGEGEETRVIVKGDDLMDVARRLERIDQNINKLAFVGVGKGAEQ